jgi:hypothetical protein
VSLNGALDYGKPQPTATRLSCDEGIEQSVTNLRGDPRTLVRYKDAIRPSSKLRLALRQLMGRQLPTLEKNFAVWRRGLHRVQQKIEERAMKQVFIALDCHWRRGKFVDDLHAFRDAGL